MKVTETPMMKQYQAIKKNHPDAIVLFRVGDTYEAYKEDAKSVIEICGTEYHVRNTEDDGDIAYTDFPHHALDTYLPRLIRAGKRVAICEDLEDPKTNKTSKPEKKMETKQINCNLTDEQLREYGEPEAYFSVEIPKEVKNIGKYANDYYGRYSMLDSVCLEPGKGKLIATDTHILYVVDVKCSGVWPKGVNGSPFQCFIDPKAIREFAGKTVDVAVWVDGNMRKVTACEFLGVLAQHDNKGDNRYPNWRNVIPENSVVTVTIAAGRIKELRDFVKAGMGKTKAEREGRFVVIHITPEADNMQARIIDSNGDEIAATYVDLAARPTHYIQQCYNAELFYYSIQEDFNGEISFTADCRPAAFEGECRTSLLMPKQHYAIGSYITSENPAKEPEEADDNDSENENEPAPF